MHDNNKIKYDELFIYKLIYIHLKEPYYVYFLHSIETKN